VTVRVEDAEPPEDNDTITGFSDNVGPEGDTLAVRFTLPAKPP